MPRTPMTPQVQKTCQGETSSATTCFLQHLSSWHLHQPRAASNALPRFRVTLTVRLRVQKNAKPKDPMTLQCKNECQWEHRSATTCLPPQHFTLHNPYPHATLTSLRMVRVLPWFRVTPTVTIKSRQTGLVSPPAF